jgi:hypothetical protein
LPSWPRRWVFSPTPCWRRPDGRDAPDLWPVLIIGNFAVSILFAVLTSQLVYVGSMSPDRVVRVRLYKYMARVPLAATIVLLVFVLVNRAPLILRAAS